MVYCYHVHGSVVQRGMITKKKYFTLQNSNSCSHLAALWLHGDYVVTM